MHYLLARALSLLPLFLMAGEAWGQWASCIPGVTASVDPPCAAQGETVTLTVHNGTNDFLVLPSSCLWQLIFKDTCGGPIVITPYCLAIIVFIPPGESMSTTWDQHDQDGNQVTPGT